MIYRFPVIDLRPGIWNLLVQHESTDAAFNKAVPKDRQRLVHALVWQAEAKGWINTHCDSRLQLNLQNALWRAR